MSKRNDFINVAISQIGYKEQTINKKSNYTKYGKWYGINPAPWCAMFVSWCANQVKILDVKNQAGLIPKYANCGDGRRWFKNKGSLTEIPHKGDVGFVMKNGAAQHTFIVEYVDGKYVHTIEGNLSDKVKRYKRKINKDLLFGNVNYGDSQYTGEFPTIPKRGYFKRVDKSEEVKKLQKFLNWAMDYNLALDGSYGNLTYNAVKKFEELVHNKKTGLFGNKDLIKAKEFKK